jgi:DNA-binding MarR family transcriptional regulator
MPLFAERMAQYELRTVDFSVLSLLRENPNITQKRLSQAISVSPPNLAILLDRLEERGLLVRQRNPLDKRSQTLALTPAGARLCARAEKTASELERDATAMLSERSAPAPRLLQKIFVAGRTSRLRTRRRSSRPAPCSGRRRDDVLQLRQLHLAVEGRGIGEGVQQPGHPPREELGAPHALERIPE